MTGARINLAELELGLQVSVHSSQHEAPFLYLETRDYEKTPPVQPHESVKTGDTGEHSGSDRLL